MLATCAQAVDTPPDRCPPPPPPRLAGSRSRVPGGATPFRPRARGKPHGRRWDRRDQRYPSFERRATNRSGRINRWLLAWDRRMLPRWARTSTSSGMCRGHVRNPLRMELGKDVTLAHSIHSYLITNSVSRYWTPLTELPRYDCGPGLSSRGTCCCGNALPGEPQPRSSAHYERAGRGPFLVQESARLGHLPPPWPYHPGLLRAQVTGRHRFRLGRPAP